MLMLLDRQREAFRREGPPTLSVRQNRIDRLLALLLDNTDAFTAAMNSDFGTRSRSASLFTEVIGVIPVIEHTRSHVAQWMRATKLLRAARVVGLTAAVEPTPLGVVGIVGPWNFPVNLVVLPAAAAFAAGAAYAAPGDARQRHPTASGLPAQARWRGGPSAQPAPDRPADRPGRAWLRHSAAAHGGHSAVHQPLALCTPDGQRRGGGPVYAGRLRCLPGSVPRGLVHRQGHLRRRCLRAPCRARPAHRAAAAAWAAAAARAARPPQRQAAAQASWGAAAPTRRGAPRHPREAAGAVPPAGPAASAAERVARPGSRPGGA